MPSNNLESFLDTHKANPGEPFTHRCLQTKQGYFVNEDDLPEFYKLYCNALRNNKQLYITERSTNVGMLRVDFDFKYEGKVDEHRHSQDQVVSFVKSWLKEFKEYIELPEVVEVFILEKDNPTFDPVSKISSSGVHIQVPDIKTKSSIEQQVRRKLLPHMPTFFADLQFAPGKTWDDVYDKSPLTHTNNWTVYGSKKPGDNSLPYLFRYILNWDSETEDISIEENVPEVIKPDVLFKHTVRSAESDITPLTEKGEAICKPTPQHDRSQSAGRGGRPAVMPGTNNSRSSSPGGRRLEPLPEELKQYYIKHLNNLGAEFYSVYNDWIKVGLCLKNIHPDDMEDAWYDFSSKYEHYNQTEAMTKWMTFGTRNEGEVLTKKSLLKWSRESNYERFLEIERQNVDKLVEEAAKTCREYDVAQIIHCLYRDEFVCSNYEKSDWYQFVGHIWKNISRGVALLAKLSSEIAKKFLKKANEENINLQNTDPCGHSPKEMKPEECHICACKIRMKQYNNMYNKLGQTGFKESVMKECKLLFHDGDFENKLNANKYLLAFNNGIYDLQNYSFRAGEPEDYITKCTNVDFNIGMVHNQYTCWNDVDKFLRSILPNTAVRTYFLRHLSSCLAGGEGSQRFHIMTGSGSNGKSIFTNLIVKSFGTYATKVPVSLMTQKRNKSSAANPEIMKMKGCRFGSMAEPDEGESLSSGLLKELSGGEAIPSRDLYAGSKEMQDFVLQIRLHLACNEKPKVNTTDGGTWRRLVVIDFPSKFVTNPNPSNPNEHLMDESIDFKVNTPEWAECFMSMLVSIYKEGNGWRKMDPPKEVMEYTNEYHEESDVITRFINEYFHQDNINPGELYDPVSFDTITRTFQEWKRSNEVGNRGSVPELRKRIDTRYGKMPRGGWSNFRFGNV